MEEQDNNLVNGEISELKPGFKFDFGKHFLPISILVAAVLVSGSILYANGGNTKRPTAQIAQGGSGNEQIGGPVDVSVDDDPFLGDDNAPVTIIEFSDYQCPFCRRFWQDTFPQIIDQYVNTGKVKFVYRDLPLSIHADAQSAAEAAECADDQGKYWQYHDKLFEEQTRGATSLSDDNLKKWAVEIGLNSSQFNKCFDSEKYREEVQKDATDASLAGATGTPSFFINGRLLVGAQPFSAFKAVIEEALLQ